MQGSGRRRGLGSLHTPLVVLCAEGMGSILLLLPTPRFLLQALQLGVCLFLSLCIFCPEQIYGFPGGSSGKESVCKCRRHKRCQLDPWVGKIPWSRKWQPTPVFLPRKSNGQRSLAGYSPWDYKESDSD